MHCNEKIKAEVPRIVAKYARRSNARAAIQVLNTGLPFLLLLYATLEILAVSVALAVACIALLSLFMLRIFVMLHECGHRSMFRTNSLNDVFGFIMGVLCGMPQYVWSRHHNHHHATNGNWEKYTGPLATISVEAFAKLSPWGQRKYQLVRNLVFTLPVASLYFIVNPRVNWVKGSLQFLLHVARGRPASGFETRYWKTRTEYWHMAGNNVVLLGLWWAGAAWFGAAAFFTVYLSCLVLGGAMGITIFAVQHNFEASYASDDANWDYHRGAVEGTSFLTLPGVANWFLADISYHHIHHLSARIPNYRLAACHREYAHLFGAVKRVRLQDITQCFRFILWDTASRKIISVAQFRRNEREAALAAVAIRSSATH